LTFSQVVWLLNLLVNTSQKKKHPLDMNLNDEDHKFDSGKF